MVAEGAGAVLARLAGVPAAALVRRLPVRGLDERAAAGAHLVDVVRRPPVVLLRLLELRRRRLQPGRHPRRRRPVVQQRVHLDGSRRQSAGAGRRRRPVHPDQHLRVIQEVLDHLVVVAQLAPDLLRDRVIGWVHLERNALVKSQRKQNVTYEGGPIST